MYLTPTIHSLSVHYFIVPSLFFFYPLSSEVVTHINLFFFCFSYRVEHRHVCGLAKSKVLRCAQWHDRGDRDDMLLPQSTVSVCGRCGRAALHFRPPRPHACAGVPGLRDVHDAHGVRAQRGRAGDAGARQRRRAVRGAPAALDGGAGRGAAARRGGGAPLATALQDAQPLLRLAPGAAARPDGAPAVAAAAPRPRRRAAAACRSVGRRGRLPPHRRGQLRPHRRPQPGRVRARDRRVRRAARRAGGGRQDEADAPQESAGEGPARVRRVPAAARGALRCGRAAAPADPLHGVRGRGDGVELRGGIHRVRVCGPERRERQLRRAGGRRRAGRRVCDQPHRRAPGPARCRRGAGGGVQPDAGRQRPLRRHGVLADSQAARAPRLRGAAHAAGGEAGPVCASGLRRAQLHSRLQPRARAAAALRLPPRGQQRCAPPEPRGGHRSHG
ncbi:hypothetical protein STCU_03824 [Strigomonas culicis]|uniref:Uncharacterized protein n=1 Tax=Strigomonas culicis TaxID=28005 RepID=S9UQ12_9TRYP|nr:hypothetical protein STCU_03824 [Strigomonas culicis]|eukprot:EPY30879.1 hypothetical protein STCU_03824 [Strigomonas culicis]